MRKYIIFLLVFVVASCAKPKKVYEQLSDTGLFGEHQMVRIESFGSVGGSVSGGFFLGIGSVVGTIGSEYKLQFWWEPKPGELIATAFPYNKFRFVIDDTKTTPSIEFLFQEWWLKDRSFFYYDETEKYDLNGFMTNVEVVKVKISRKILEEEVYFPKLTK